MTDTTESDVNELPCAAVAAYEAAIQKRAEAGHIPYRRAMSWHVYDQADGMVHAWSSYGAAPRDSTTVDSIAGDLGVVGPWVDGCAVVILLHSAARQASAPASVSRMRAAAVDQITEAASIIGWRAVRDLAEKHMTSPGSEAMR